MMDINPFLLEAFAVEYRKEYKGKPATMNRVHFSNWVANKLYHLAYELDDDMFWDWQSDYMKAQSKTIYKKYQKSLDE